MKPIERPAHRLAVWHKKAKLVQPELLLAVKRTSHESVDRKGRNGHGFSFNSRADDCILRALIINNIDQNPEDVSFSCVMHSPLHRSILSS